MFLKRHHMCQYLWVLVGTRGVEGITCYLSGDYAASASNGGKTQAGSRAQVLLKRGECRTNCNSSDLPPPPPLPGQFIQSQESVCIYNGLHWIGTGIRSLLAFEGILINLDGIKLANVTSHNGPLNLSD